MLFKIISITQGYADNTNSYNKGQHYCMNGTWVQGYFRGQYPNCTSYYNNFISQSTYVLNYKNYS